MTATHDSRPLARRLLRRAATSSEARGLALVVILVYAASLLSPYFWQPHYLLFDTGRYLEFGALALAMTIVIATGEIDLSVGSAVGLCGAVIALLYTHGLPMAASVAVSVVLGALLGLVNGLAVTLFRLPSLVVTLATMAAFRGLAQVLLGPRNVVFPEFYGGLDRIGFTGTAVDVPALLVAFIVVGLAFAVLLHRTTYGRLCLLIGSSRDAARYSGIRVDRIRLIGFVLCGLMGGVVAVMYTSRLGSVDYQAGTGYELLAITVVVLGGANIFGGRASMISTMIALFSVIAIREGMSVRGLNGATQDAVVGALLIVSILLPNLLRMALTRMRRTRRRSATPAGAQPDMDLSQERSVIHSGGAQ